MRARLRHRGECPCPGQAFGNDPSRSNAQDPQIDLLSADNINVPRAPEVPPALPHCIRPMLSADNTRPTPQSEASAASLQPNVNPHCMLPTCIDPARNMLRTVEPGPSGANGVQARFAVECGSLPVTDMCRQHRSLPAALLPSPICRCGSRRCQCHGPGQGFRSRATAMPCIHRLAATAHFAITDARDERA